MFKFLRFWKNCLLYGEDYAILIERLWSSVDKLDAEFPGQK